MQTNREPSVALDSLQSPSPKQKTFGSSGFLAESLGPKQRTFGSSECLAESQGPKQNIWKLWIPGLKQRTFRSFWFLAESPRPQNRTFGSSGFPAEWPLISASMTPRGGGPGREGAGGWRWDYHRHFRAVRSLQPREGQQTAVKVEFPHPRRRHCGCLLYHIHPCCEGFFSDRAGNCTRLNLWRFI